MQDNSRRKNGSWNIREPSLHISEHNINLPRCRRLLHSDRLLQKQQRRCQILIWKHAASLTMMQMDRAVDDLESRQLAEEMKMVKEFEAEKKTVMMRLRHMEAYCQNPTPPPPPVDLIPGQASSQEQALPERKVTDRDYHSLAQQYRERDAMDDLHASKINVLRGKQKKAAENFVMKKEREIDALKEQQAREIDDLETDALKEEDGVRIAFDLKRARLESRWRLQ